MIEDRLLDWHFSYLGNVPKNDYRACARLALSRGYDYMSILGGTNCLSSSYLPLATSPHRIREKGQCRLDPKVFFINGKGNPSHNVELLSRDKISGGSRGGALGADATPF